MEMTSKMVDVYGYSNELDIKHDIAIATVGTVWTKPVTGESYLLVFNQCILFGDCLKHSLICPNQLRARGIIVQDIPSQFDNKSQHAIIHEAITIPLELAGVFSYFETRIHCEDEGDTLPHLQFTSTSDLEEFSSTIPGSEARPPVFISSLTSQRKVPHGPILLSYQEAVTLPEILDDYQLSKRVIAAVRVSATYPKCPTPEIDPISHNVNIDPADRPANELVVSTNERKSFLTHIALSKRWGITWDAAKATIDVSSQTAVRNTFTPSEQKVRKKAPWLEFPSIKCEIYIDSMFSKLPSVGALRGAPFIQTDAVTTVFTPGNVKARTLIH
jgi:hypothetical protein